MAELKITPKKGPTERYAVFEFTLKKKIPIFLLEDSVKDAGWEQTDKLPLDFKGRTDEDLVGWVRKIINEWHYGDPLQFTLDWELAYDADLTCFDIKLEK